MKNVDNRINYILFRIGYIGKAQAKDAPKPRQAIM
jgi:hypothetical protein